ncbi:MAG TPA: phosphodiesterase, partial [Mycobacterium sp.]|nr:phosphodiesterase [Mycobacterium sp.]
GVSLNSVRNQLKNGTIEVTLDQARGTSAFDKLARLTLHGLLVAPHGGDVSFDPVLHTAPGVELYPGWLAGLRASAYDRSRDGRDAD